ncbi:unnamed protein product [Paramecium sonneborni]|uniref:Uncharacterized protein n=1 Tax=Paramecium sonneborni TaxID=65129 RepID=A0A8S1RPX8_9CILI|nr:unnamed protein product [Paramecium sonneborni]
MIIKRIAQQIIIHSKPVNIEHLIMLQLLQQGFFKQIKIAINIKKCVLQNQKEDQHKQLKLKQFVLDKYGSNCFFYCGEYALRICDNAPFSFKTTNNVKNLTSNLQKLDKDWMCQKDIINSNILKVFAIKRVMLIFEMQELSKQHMQRLQTVDMDAQQDQVNVANQFLRINVISHNECDDYLNELMMNYYLNYTNASERNEGCIPLDSCTTYTAQMIFLLMVLKCLLQQIMVKPIQLDVLLLRLILLEDHAFSLGFVLIEFVQMLKSLPIIHPQRMLHIFIILRCSICWNWRCMTQLNTLRSCQLESNGYIIIFKSYYAHMLLQLIDLNQMKNVILSSCTVLRKIRNLVKTLHNNNNVSLIFVTIYVHWIQLQLLLILKLDLAQEYAFTQLNCKNWLLIQIIMNYQLCMLIVHGMFYHVQLELVQHHKYDKFQSNRLQQCTADAPTSYIQETTNFVDYINYNQCQKNYSNYPFNLVDAASTQKTCITIFNQTCCSVLQSLCFVNPRATAL